MNNNGFELSESEIDGLLRRLDFNNDERVTYDDFRTRVEIIKREYSKIKFSPKKTILTP